MREKLIELLEQGHREYFNRCSGMDKTFIEFIGDYLIANGVTVREKGEWIWKDFHKADGTVERKAVCSLCYAQNKQYRPPYCPHCGAEMERGT